MDSVLFLINERGGLCFDTTLCNVYQVNLCCSNLYCYPCAVQNARDNFTLPSDRWCFGGYKSGSFCAMVTAGIFVSSTLIYSPVQTTQMIGYGVGTGLYGLYWAALRPTCSSPADCGTRASKNQDFNSLQSAACFIFAPPCFMATAEYRRKYPRANFASKPAAAQQPPAIPVLQMQDVTRNNLISI